MTRASVDANTLATNLYKDLIKEMSLKSPNSKGESTFMIRVTKKDIKLLRKMTLSKNWSNIQNIYAFSKPQNLLQKKKLKPYDPGLLLSFRP